MVVRAHMEVKVRGKSASITAGPRVLVLGRRRSAGQSLTFSMWVNYYLLEKEQISFGELAIYWLFHDYRCVTLVIRW